MNKTIKIFPHRTVTSIPWRAAHSAVMIQDSMIIFGGVSSSNIFDDPMGSNQVMVWNAQTFSWYLPQVNAQNEASVLPQKFVPAVQLTSGGKALMLLSNVTGSNPIQSQLARLDVNFWSWDLPASSQTFNPPDLGIGVSFTAINDKIYRYGGMSLNSGNSKGGVVNLLWTVDANTLMWGQGPNGPTLAYHSACYMSDFMIIVMFGGQDADFRILNTLNIYNIQSKSWKLDVQTSGGSPPSPRRAHTAVCTSNKMIIFGGGTTTAADDAVWLLTASSDEDFTWSNPKLINQSKGPGGRFGHSAVLNGRKMLVYGGAGSQNGDTNVYMLDTVAWNWTAITSDSRDNSLITSNINVAIGTSKNGVNKTNRIVAIVAGVIGGLLILLILITIIMIVYRRSYNQSNGSYCGRRTSNMRQFGNRFNIDEEDRARDLSYHSTDDPSVDIMANRVSRDRRSTAMSSDLLIPTPAAARVANKDTILNAAAIPVLFNNNDKSQISYSRNVLNPLAGHRLSAISSNSDNNFGISSPKNLYEEEQADGSRWTFVSSPQQQSGVTPPIRYMAPNRDVPSGAGRHVNHGSPALSPNSYDSSWIRKYYIEDEDDDSVGLGVHLARPVTPPEVIVTAPRVPPNSAHMSPTLPPEYTNGAGIVHSGHQRMSAPVLNTDNDRVMDNSVSGIDGSTIPSGGVIYDGLSPLDRIARLFSGDDVAGSILRSEKESVNYLPNQSNFQRQPQQTMTYSGLSEDHLPFRTGEDELYGNVPEHSSAEDAHDLKHNPNSRETMSMQSSEEAVNTGITDSRDERNQRMFANDMAIQSDEDGNGVKSGRSSHDSVNKNNRTSQERR
ncbi:hypothetical protein G9A89_005282 [Geosiphon pyriformis]|nr:hypothetical protein G9A89_005282 [Geosiphon pyriformis]